MKKWMTLAAVVLPFLVFGQQPLKNTYGKYVEVIRTKVEWAGVSWTVRESAAKMETIFAKKEQLTKKQLKCHLKKGIEYGWGGSLPELFIYLDAYDYEAVEFLPPIRGKLYGLDTTYERILFRKKQ